MPFGSLRRSNSQSGRSGRRSSAARPVTYYGGPVDPRQQALADYEQAKIRYDAEQSLIMKDERTRFTRTQTECKYRMDSADRKLRQERARLDNYIAYHTDIAQQQHSAGRIDRRELEKMLHKLKKRTDMEWNSFYKWHQDQLGSAQKNMFDTGDQIGAETGAAIRRAKGKLEVAERYAERYARY